MQILVVFIFYYKASENRVFNCFSNMVGFTEISVNHILFQSSFDNGYDLVFRSLISMTKNQPSISSNGEVSNQKQGHHIHVILAMNDFWVQRFVAWFFSYILLYWRYFYLRESFIKGISDCCSAPSPCMIFTIVGSI